MIERLTWSSFELHNHQQDFNYNVSVQLRIEICGARSDLLLEMVTALSVYDGG